MRSATKYIFTTISHYLVEILYLVDREHCSNLNLDYSHMRYLVTMAHDCLRDFH